MRVGVWVKVWVRVQDRIGVAGSVPCFVTVGGVFVFCDGRDVLLSSDLALLDCLVPIIHCLLSIVYCLLPCLLPCFCLCL